MSILIQMWETGGDAISEANIFCEIVSYLVLLAQSNIFCNDKYYEWWRLPAHVIDIYIYMQTVAILP